MKDTTAALALAALAGIGLMRSMREEPVKPQGLAAIEASSCVKPVPCSATKNAPCPPPEGVHTFCTSFPLTPVRYGGVGRKPWHWQWIKAGAAERACTAEERKDGSVWLRNPCDAQVGEVLMLTQPLKQP